MDWGLDRGAYASGTRSEPRQALDGNRLLHLLALGDQVPTKYEARFAGWQTSFPLSARRDNVFDHLFVSHDRSL